MNTRNLPASFLLLAIGAASVLLIGAFSRFEPANPPSTAALPPAPPALTQEDPPAQMASALTLPSDLSPGLAEIIKLTQAHVDESVILAYIKNSGQVFLPTAEEILYLADLGLSQDIIGTLVKTAPLAATSSAALEPAPTPVPAPTATATMAEFVQPQLDANASFFYNDLASYGTWTQQPDYGLCWLPSVETIDPEWRPYVDSGQWVSSDCGWYWQSDYRWGWAAFHYGRWARVPRLGWVWVPGNLWAPAWVAWRTGSSSVGWAPLPPGVGLNVLAQLTYLGRPAGVSSTFGLSSSAYTFVSTGDLTSRQLPRRVLPAREARVQNTAAAAGYSIVNNRIFNGGVSRAVVAAAAGRAVPEVSLRSVSSPEASGLAMDRKTLAVYRPVVSSTAATKPLAMNATRVQASTQRTSDDQTLNPEENDAAEAAVMPVAEGPGEVSVQLPPLRYAGPAAPPLVHRRHRDSLVASSAPDSTPPQRDWPRGFPATTVEHPGAPAPPTRFDGFNSPGRPTEPPRPPVENRPVAGESRPAPVEPIRGAPAPPAPSHTQGGSRSGK